MFQRDKLNSELTFIQKIKKLDYILIISIILLSIISLFVMYSTDGGEVLYHTKSHFIKVVTFFFLMLVISFLNISSAFWYTPPHSSGVFQQSAAVAGSCAPRLKQISAASSFTLISLIIKMMPN